MKPVHVLAAALVIGMSALCVRLGFWQISRWHEKQGLNAEMRATLASPVVLLRGDPGAYATVRGHRVAARGTFDESRQVLLSLRTREGSPGVEVVTPLVLAGGRQAVLVDRGWLYASDGATARPQDYPERAEREVTGVPVALGHAAGGGAAASALRLLTTDSLTLWSARTLDPDTLAGRFPYALAPWMLRELPGPGVPSRPSRAEPRPLDEMMHVSYAVQWFLFASILLGGSAALVTSRRRRPRSGGEPRAVSEADPDLYRHG